MEMAKLASTRGTCRVKVGCIVTAEDRVILTGYNGSPSGQPHCVDVGCEFYGYIKPEYLRERSTPKYTYTYYDTESTDEIVQRCQRSIHAEQNVIGIAARYGINLEYATWYTYPFAPCQQCSLLLSVTKPYRLVFPENHDRLYNSVGPIFKDTIVDVINFQ